MQKNVDDLHPRISNLSARNEWVNSKFLTVVGVHGREKRYLSAMRSRHRQLENNSTSNVDQINLLNVRIYLILYFSLAF